jgi:predicted chitinase
MGEQSVVYSPGLKRPGFLNIKTMAIPFFNIFKFPPWLAAILSGETAPPVEPVTPQPIKPEPSEPAPEPGIKPTDEWLARFAKTLNTTLNKDQGKAVRLILLECKEHGVTDKRHIAYILATCWHECRFKSIKEIRAKVGTDVWKMQEKYWHTGFYGRGFCQLTWEYNYKKFSPITGRDLVKNPDEVLLPEVGALILVRGMRDGLFSGKSLGDYLNDTKTNWMQARRVVNGNFQADKVMDAALKILPLLA